MGNGKKTKKVNPRRKPATQADVNRAKAEGESKAAEALSKAVDIAWAIMFTVLRDKFGFGPKRLGRAWGFVNSLSEEVAAGTVSVQDLKDVLREEAQIELVEGEGKHEA